MAGYVLGFPGKRGPGNPALLQQLGLGSLAVDCGPDWWDGPTGDGYGLLCGWGLGLGDDGPMGGPVERTWQPLPANEACGRQAGEVWLGLEVARPLVPRNIARRKFLPGGQFVELGDGQSWYVPVAARLPHKGRLNAAGKFERTILPKYAEFFAKSEGYYRRLTTAIDEAGAQGSYDVDFVDGYEFAWDALALNYRLCHDIASVLNIVDDSAALRVICVAICQEDISDFAFTKKKEQLRIPVC